MKRISIIEYVNSPEKSYLSSMPPLQNNFVRRNVKKVWINLLWISAVFMFVQCSDKSVMDDFQDAEVVLKSADFSGDKGKASFKITCSNFNFNDIEEAGGYLDKIYLKSVGSNGHSGNLIQIWDSLEVFNLLDMTTGIMADLGFLEIPEGTYSKAIVHIKSAWVVYKGVRYNCKVPGGNMVLAFKDPLLVGTHLSPEIILDMDVSKSFIPIYGGNEKNANKFKKNRMPKSFIMKPVVRVVNGTYAGRLAGAVLSSNYEPLTNALVTVTNGVESYQSYSLSEIIVDEFFIEHYPGEYSVNAIPAGDYSVTVSKEGYADITTNVTIVKGNFTIESFVMESL